MKIIFSAIIAVALPLLVYAQPAAPTGFGASTLSTTSVVLSWTDNSTNETGFQIERSTSAASGFVLVATAAANATSYINTGLATGTQYFYRIRSTNASGQSAYATVSSATTGLRRFLLDFGGPKTLSGWNVIPAPTTGSVTNLNDVTGAGSSLSLTVVKDPSNGYGAYSANGAPQVVLDYPQSAASDSHYGWQSGGSYRINGLDNSKVYSIRIFSSRMYVGDARIGIFTINGQALTIDATNNTTKTIHFTNLTPTNGTLNISFTLGSGVAFAYINVMDIVEGSNTPVTPPAAPTNLAATATSPTQVKLMWTDASTDETNFQVERGTGSSFNVVATLAANTTTYTDNSLAENTKYYYRVKAINNGGSSAYVTADATTPVSIPSTPTGLAATAVSSSSITLKWNDVSNNETGFEIVRDSFVFVVAANTSTYTDTDLVEGTMYSYKVRSKNSAGASNFSSVASATTFTPPPTAPSDLIATTVSSKRVDLIWSDNSSNENGFKVERSNGGGYVLIADIKSNKFSDSTLSAVATYTYRVASYNAGGSSTYSNEASATTLDSAPLSPTNLVATALSSSRIKLSWVDASSNETGFEIERNDSLVAIVPTNNTSFIDTALSASTNYSYRIRSVNSIGYSSYVQASGTTLPLPPDAPSLLTATAVSSSQIDLTWTGNAPSFIVERLNGGSFTTIATISTSVYSDKTLAENTSYFYRVKASNAGGSSPESNETSATTLIAPPASPTSFAATSSSPTQVSLTWNDVSQNEDGFILERSTSSSSGFVLIDSLAANTKSFADNNLTASTQYFYRIKSFNSRRKLCIRASERYNAIAYRTLRNNLQRNGFLFNITIPDYWNRNNTRNEQTYHNGQPNIIRELH